MLGLCLSIDILAFGWVLLYLIRLPAGPSVVLRFAQRQPRSFYPIQRLWDLAGIEKDKHGSDDDSPIRHFGLWRRGEWRHTEVSWWHNIAFFISTSRTVCISLSLSCVLFSTVSRSTWLEYVLGLENINHCIKLTSIVISLYTTHARMYTHTRTNLVDLVERRHPHRIECWSALLSFFCVYRSRRLSGTCSNQLHLNRVSFDASS